jgi:hypothetical protein
VELGIAERERAREGDLPQPVCSLMAVCEAAPPLSLPSLHHPPLERRRLHDLRFQVGSMVPGGTEEAELICLDRRSRGIYGSTQAAESASMCGSRGRAGGVRPSLLAAFSFPTIWL